MFGYQAHHELAVLRNQLSRNVYSVPDNTRIYSYYQGCSEGGREGWSQAQRFATQFDGLAIGAPALRLSQLQPMHLVQDIQMQTVDYYPPNCELQKIVELIIVHCDPLDGRADGVVSRSDVCLSQFDFDSIIGTAYSTSCTIVDSFGVTTT
jgi:tannase